MKISEYITKDISALDPNSSVKEAANMFDMVSYSHLPIVENNLLIGLISESDIRTLEDSDATLKEFTKVQYPENDNKRGLGFDKPLLNNFELPISEAYPAPGASPESFGHSGFTGTFVWADPTNNLVFIFLSNRVYPTRDHKNIYTLNIRTALHQVFYSENSKTTDETFRSK